MNSKSSRIYIQEVSVRDGFQIEPVFVPTQDKIRLINALSKTGLAKIEVTSFTSPKAIPALADAREVMLGIERVPGVEYAALVPNLKGAQRALECQVDEINLVMSASESHNRANLRMSTQESLEQFAAIAALVNQTTAINVSFSTAFGCPFEGPIAEQRVMDLLEAITSLGITRIALCDTTGMAFPSQVEQLCGRVKAQWPQLRLTGHFHNTRGMGLANVLSAISAGVVHFDASLGGLGGCPFAPGASGNICTEDLVHMLEGMGFHTGVQLSALLTLSAQLPALVGHDIPGQVVKAGPASRRYPLSTQ
jgi:hydroxymethylglutaryl-CoA lyase